MDTLIRRFALIAVLVVALCLVTVAFAQGRPTDEPPPPTSQQDLVSAIADTTPDLNAMNPNSPQYGKLRLPPAPKKWLKPTDPPSPGQEDFGAWIHEVQTEYPGAYAAHEVHLSFTLPEPPPEYSYTLYAPTLMSPNDARLEAVTAYWRYNGSSETGRAFGVWDHLATGDNWVVFKPMNKQFEKRYVRPCGPGECYWVEIYGSPSGESRNWNVYLYNFQRSKWEVQHSAVGSYPERPYGWNIYESYFYGDCPAVPRIASDVVQVHDDAGWHYVTPDYGAELNRTECPYDRLYEQIYWYWWIETPE